MRITRVRSHPIVAHGWVSARVRSRATRMCECATGIASRTTQRASPALTVACTAVTNKNVPVIGFAAWSRKMAVNPDASYGRIVEHSYRAAAATPSTTPSP